ncbi:MAG: FadR family transcriptional regulator [Desulfobacteraceae bacterium]|nr:MAG: FadR family transcriptional regulator [Desulfobacteraceae bacterium]
MKFRPVKQNRIAIGIVNQLKDAIFSGQFKSGERIPTERELTEHFQVSRVVVREAVRELEIRGLVKILQGPTGGAYVADLTFDQLNNALLDLFLCNKLSVAELIQTRILIEMEIARLAATRVNAEFARRLQEALDAEAFEDLSHAEFVFNRLMVHKILAEMCGNRLLQAIASSLHRLIGELLLEVKPVNKIIHRQEEHAEIVYAILAGNTSGAEEAMKKHLSSVGKKLIQLEEAYRKRKKLTL